MKDSPIPVVDLSKSQQECVDLIQNACKTHGAFYVVNHSVSPQLIQKQFAESRKFFELPQGEKDRLFIGGANRGYAPVYAQLLDPKKQSVGDMKEAIYLGSEVPNSNTILHAPNVWPDENLLPQFRKVMEQYKAAVTALGDQIIQLLALSLGLESNFFEPMFDQPLTLLKPQRYIEDISQPEQGRVASGAHYDWGCFTLLMTDGVPGLQVFHEDVWIDVPQIENAFICNMGNMMCRWTNEHYKSPLHRVLKLTKQERYSTPLFYEPNYHTLIQCLPTCVGDGPKFAPITAGQAFIDKFNSTHTLENKL